MIFVVVAAVGEDGRVIMKILQSHLTDSLLNRSNFIQENRKLATN